MITIRLLHLGTDLPEVEAFLEAGESYFLEAEEEGLCLMKLKFSLRLHKVDRWVHFKDAVSVPIFSISWNIDTHNNLILYNFTWTI